MLASSSTSETGNARRQHTSPTERDAASDTSHDPRTRSVPTSSAPPSSRDARATLSPAPTTLASTRIGARRTAIMYLQREQRDDVARQRSALMTRIVTSPRLHTMRLDRSSSTRASGSHDAAEQLPSAPAPSICSASRFFFWQFSRLPQILGAGGGSHGPAEICWHSHTNGKPSTG